MEVGSKVRSGCGLIAHAVAETKLAPALINAIGDTVQQRRWPLVLYFSILVGVCPLFLAGFHVVQWCSRLHVVVACERCF